MAEIPFTQYIRPDGHPLKVSIERPDEIVRKAEYVIKKGFSFECEHLRTGYVSFTVADRKNGVDLDIELVPNGPAVPAAVDRLVERNYAFFKKLEERIN